MSDRRCKSHPWSLPRARGGCVACEIAELVALVQAEEAEKRARASKSHAAFVEVGNRHRRAGRAA